MKIDFKFALGFDVLIRRNGIVGVVRIAAADRRGRQRFYVQYADGGGMIHEKWFDADDLENVTAADAA